jgi:hypothetical protein
MHSSRGVWAMLPACQQQPQAVPSWAVTSWTNIVLLRLVLLVLRCCRCSSMQRSMTRATPQLELSGTQLTSEGAAAGGSVGVARAAAGRGCARLCDTGPADIVPWRRPPPQKVSCVHQWHSEAARSSDLHNVCIQSLPSLPEWLCTAHTPPPPPPLSPSSPAAPPPGRPPPWCPQVRQPQAALHRL